VLPFVLAGKEHDALCEALDRLEGTRIKTDIRTRDEEQTAFNVWTADCRLFVHARSFGHSWCWSV
jgi:Replication initiator protein A